MDTKQKASVITRLKERAPNTEGSAYWLGRWEKNDLETTGTQTWAIPINQDGVIYPPELQIPYPLRLEMLRHPTIAMARQLAIAPMVLAEWQVKSTPDARQSAIWIVEDEVLKRKTELLERAMKDCFDFGFQVNEIVWNPDGKTRNGDDAITISKVKPLFPYLTYLRANPLNGEFAGVKQYDMRSGYVHYLEREDVQLFNVDVEGTNHYGNSMLDNVRQPYMDWKAVRQTSLCYLNKIAGAHWVVYYPDGSTMYNGSEMANQSIANDLLQKVEANAGVALPSDVGGFIFDQNSKSQNRLWDIQMQSDSGSSSAAYVDQLRHFQELMVMGFMFPPRALLEGQFGTKAEAVAHAEAAVASMEMISCRFARQLSQQLVNQLLELNFGASERDSVWLEVSPITNNKMDWIRQVFMTLLAQPDTSFSLLEEVDLKTFSQKVGL